MEVDWGVSAARSWNSIDVERAFFLFRGCEQEQIMGGVWSIISCGIINSRRFSLPGLCCHVDV